MTSSHPSPASEHSPASPSDLVEVGHISGAYGLQGWVRVTPYVAQASEAGALLNARHWWLRPDRVRSPSSTTLADIERLQVRTQGADIVAALAGIATREQADALRGTVVLISREDFPPLDEGEFYWVDLIGMTVQNLQGEIFGVVTGLIENGAHPVLRIAHPEKSAASEMMIPFVAAFVSAVEHAQRRIVVDWQKDY